MDNRWHYEETVSSNLTELLFAGLTILFVSLAFWRVSTQGYTLLSVGFLLLAAFFLFYSLNYRKLLIRISADNLWLKFGVFSWTVPLGNIKACRLDDLPLLMKYGGAGIHFMLIQGRYRASFNFLDGPRVVIELKNKAGLVRDVSFSTRRPEEVMRLIWTRGSVYPSRV